MSNERDIERRDPVDFQTARRRLRPLRPTFSPEQNSASQPTTITQLRSEFSVSRQVAFGKEGTKIVGLHAGFASSDGAKRAYQGVANTTDASEKQAGVIGFLEGMLGPILTQEAGVPLSAFSPDQHALIDGQIATVATGILDIFDTIQQFAQPAPPSKTTP